VEENKAVAIATQHRGHHKKHNENTHLDTFAQLPVHLEACGQHQGHGLVKIPDGSAGCEVLV